MRGIAITLGLAATASLGATFGPWAAESASAAAPSTTPSTTPAVAPAKVRSSVGLNVRVGPGTEHRRTQRLRNGQRVEVACRVEGQLVKGEVRTTSIWNRLRSGGYVSDAYVTSGPVPPPCGVPVGTAASASEDAFIGLVAGFARQGRQTYGVPASVTTAQAILESGFGTSALTKEGNALFGIKCFEGQPGPVANGCRSYRTHECEPGGRCQATKAAFRTYASHEASVRDHGRFLRVNGRYASAFGVAGNADAFAIAIHKAGYATDPKYSEKLIKLMRRYDLYRFDR